MSGWLPDGSILRARIADVNDLSTMCRADICPGFAAPPVRLPPASGRSTPMHSHARDRCVSPTRLDPANGLTPRRIGTQPDPSKEHTMPESICTSSGDGKLDALEGMPFPKEDELQALIAEHPELLDGEHIRPGDARRWNLVTREKGIAPSAGRVSCEASASPSFLVHAPACHGARRRRREDRGTLPASA